MPTDNTPKDQNTAEDYQKLFILAKTPSNPILTRNNILAVLACVISIRPFFHSFVGESGPFLLELCFNSAAWIAVVAAYKFVSKNSIRKRWWVVASGAVSFLTLYTFLGLEHRDTSFKIMDQIESYFRFKNPLTVLVLPAAMCILCVAVAFSSKGRMKSAIVAITTALFLTFLFPIVWFLVFFVYTALFGFV